MNSHTIKVIAKYVMGIKPRDVSPPHLRKVDPFAVPDDPEEIRLFMIVRNESRMLPYLFDYYFSRGVDRIFVIDNDSNDGTESFLSGQANTHVFHTKADYSGYWDWITFLLGKYGSGHWCLSVDADELLIYPHWEQLSIPDVCRYLEQRGYNALDAILLDMYSAKPVCEAEYATGSDPLLSAPYFDPDSHYERWNPLTQKKRMIMGGMRRRVFGFTPYLSKIPLFRYDPEMSLSQGTHLVSKAKVSDIRAAILHFKYFNDFKTAVEDGVRRGVYWDNSREYKSYVKMLSRPDFSIYHEKSTRFTGSRQLTKAGIMKDSTSMQAFAVSATGLNVRQG